MSKQLTRRSFLSVVAALPFANVLNPLESVAQPFSQTEGQKRARGPRLDLELVQEFVRAAHVDLDKVQRMLKNQAALVNSTWDWGDGDWETGLGGASHMGRRDIALYLLDHGARIDLFAATMLGELDIVKATVAAFPGIHKVPGPHGIPLIAHAEKGGEHAADVLTFLQTLDSA